MLRIIAVLGLSIVFGFSQCTTTETTKKPIQISNKVIQNDSLNFPKSIVKIEKTEKEWAAQLTDNEYDVLREHGTERAFTGTYWNAKKAGVYTCRACNLPLFNANTKFDSGTGWPSFWQPIRVDYVGETKDTSYGMIRREVHCARCNGHLGHIFEDGPKPTGLRYCINSVSLNFIAE